MPAQAEASDLGGGGGLHARRRHRVPHAARLAAAHASGRATSSSSGAAPAASAARRSRSPGRRARSRSPSSRATTRSSSASSSARRACINRKQFSHWGMLPHWKDDEGVRRVARRAPAPSARRSGRCVGERKSPRIVFEHPGEDTVPTSIFVCDTGGMVVICAGTTGYNADARPALPLDAAEALPGLALRQRRAGGRRQRPGDRRQGRSLPVQVFPFAEIPHVHQLMHENRHPHGNMAILVDTPREGLKTLP